MGEEMDKRDSYINEVRQLFAEADMDKSGFISWKEFRTLTNDSRVQAYLQSLELDTSEVHGLFKLLDADDTNSVSTEELITGCLRLKGPSKQLDVVTLLYENKRM